MCVPRDLANRWTDIVLLYREACIGYGGKDYKNKGRVLLPFQGNRNLKTNAPPFFGLFFLSKIKTKSFAPSLEKSTLKHLEDSLQLRNVFFEA